MNNHVKVSVFVICYNHKNFLRECLDSILIQQADFDYEVLVHDDASTDGSAEIIKEYASKYSKIKAVLQTQNQYTKGVKPFSILKAMSKGKYIAWCEGDDFWGDEFKLKKQFDFMENNSEYSICYHDSKVINEKSELINESKVKDIFKVDYNSSDLKKGKFSIPTQSSFFISSFNLPLHYSRVVNEDTFIFIILGSHGKGKYLDNIKPSHYRIHSGGIWSKQEKSKIILHLKNTYNELSKFYLSQNSYYLFLYFLLRRLKLEIRNV